MGFGVDNFMNEKFIVEYLVVKCRVEISMVEKFLLAFGLKTPGLRLWIEMSCNPYSYQSNFTIGFTFTQFNSCIPIYIMYAFIF